ncbi:MBL fold metallo-hydrolase [Thiosocius teredinicola]|uniref:MBL fold metallo-hydrolase n=1 Tax=Thiosocius teredinicola TaxID=1973002 RepID=UPI000990A21C
MKTLFAALSALLLATNAMGADAPSTCAGTLAVQVLGSGGPIADDDRASSGYLVWLDGKAKVMVDVGGGVFLRFGQSGADIADLDAIVLTHLHTDHAADLPALLKSGYFSSRTRPLPIIGPTGKSGWPATSEFLQALFGQDRGAFRYLAGYLDGSDDLFEAIPTDVDATITQPLIVLQTDDIKVSAVGVRHGIVPALGLTVEARGKRIAFSGDQSDDNPAFAALSKDVNLLVMAHAIPQEAGHAARSLHATPRRIGRLAADSGVKKLVLSHLMARSLRTLEQNKALIAEAYRGPMSVARDLDCFTLIE